MTPFRDNAKTGCYPALSSFPDLPWGSLKKNAYFFHHRYTQQQNLYWRPPSSVCRSKIPPAHLPLSSPVQTPHLQL
ncbi:hypothetical protein TrLO_g15245 [Triparma laevis f. longispina]|uniref:Uncharacterized protein n=1 Tax=Triparma laevis f. longispina TaxID=1714387 RepID=A0A9W7DWH8_9STRA|nr:hypothetical protein TrLO_g15245 [Triparma laevis f. longispina]